MESSSVVGMEDVLHFSRWSSVDFAIEWYAKIFLANIFFLLGETSVFWWLWKWRAVPGFPPYLAYVRYLWQFFNFVSQLYFFFFVTQKVSQASPVILLSHRVCPDVTQGKCPMQMSHQRPIALFMRNFGFHHCFVFLSILNCRYFPHWFREREEKVERER